VHNTPDLADAMQRQLPGVMIVDNGSEPSILGAHIWLPRNRGFAGGWNDAMVGMYQLGAEWVWMLNSDVAGASPDMARELAGQATAGGYAVVTPAFNSPHALFHRADSDGIRPVSWIDWCCPMVSMVDWIAVGPFDERSTGYFADIDWCYRARMLGSRFAVADGLRVEHAGGETARRMGHTWDADDGWLREKWGKRWTEMV
jgi:GT2 family glycosyltransferase